ncbi:TonB family protein [Pseudorhodobacter sp.]|uniref:TonB family protein n=1 Tax=Pseudorhodobacter sp. TaxID=1934400 RepID=UPI0026479DA3|nr:TonB family protein [Pseudorhodobacter sp.]MDN5788605.1 TonB family protein [Pseudorhodobacter sp.]
MKSWVEFCGFLGIALGAHLLIWQGSSASGLIGSAELPASGAVALAGANEAMQDLVADWNSAPEVVEATPDLQPEGAKDAEANALLPTAAVPPTPFAPSALPVPDTEKPLVTDTAPPPPLPETTRAKQEIPRPASKPAKATTRSGKPKASASTQRAKSKTGGQAAGNSGAGGTAPTKANADQMARWGGAIRSSIERRKRYPAGSRAKGTVSLAISVTSGGALSGLAIARSSGDAALDRAALDAVKRARLPKAPGGIPAGTHRFTLSIAFAR